MEPGLLLYDADCGFCTRTASYLPRLRLTAERAALQEVGLGALGVDAERAVREMPYVCPDGRVLYGHEAWAAALGTGPLPMRLLGRLLGSRLLRPVAARSYRWVSENRYRLPGGTAACALPDQAG